MIRKMYNLGGRFASFSEVTLQPLWNLLARIYLFVVFYKSAILKVSDILNGHADRVVFLFEYEYRLPIPHLMAPFTSFLELICAFLVLIGLFSRTSGFLLLMMAIFIHFWYVEHVSHILWMFLSSYVVVYGGGKLSVDSIWCHTIGKLKESGNSKKSSEVNDLKTVATKTKSTATKKPATKKSSTRKTSGGKSPKK